MDESKVLTVIGAGPVAIEFIGELAGKYGNDPTKKINIITQCNTLLETITPDAHVVVSKHLSKFNNVKILYNRKVNCIKNDKVFFQVNEEGGEEKMSSLKSDMIFVCVGFRPNTDMFKKYMDFSVNKRGYVHIDEYLRVKHMYSSRVKQGQPNSDYGKEEENDEDEIIWVDRPKEDSDVQCIDNEELDLEELEKIDGETLQGKFFQAYMGISKRDDVDKAEAKDNNQNKEAVVEEVSERPLNNSFSNIFAIGDITVTKEHKMAYIARLHADLVVKNILNKELNVPLVPHDFFHSKSPLQVITYSNSKAFGIRGNRIYAKGYFVYKFKTFIETNLYNEIKNV